jgi:hypothetical protein
MSSVIPPASSADAERPIGFKACSFSWDSFSGSVSAGKKKQRHTRERFELHFDGEVTFKRDALNLIIGPTASGKVYYIKIHMLPGTDKAFADISLDGAPW